MATVTTSQAPGVIDANASYTLQEFYQRTGIKRAGLRRLRRAGLKVARVGKVAFVRGAAWLEFLERAEHED